MTVENTKKKRLHGLYAITDQHLITEEDFSYTIEQALQGGVRIIQYRDKSNSNKKRLQQAGILCSLCREYNATSIINDDIELAKAVDAHGVHLGKDDNSITRARETLGDDAIIGVSCYNELGLAIKAEKEGADYVAFGAMFSSPTKPHAPTAELTLITRAKQKISSPICTIGGITNNNIQQLILNGTDMAAVISSLFSNKDIKNTARALSKNFN